MSRYLLFFGWTFKLAKGGINDLLDHQDELERSIRILEIHAKNLHHLVCHDKISITNHWAYKWAHIYDTKTREIVWAKNDTPEPNVLIS